MDTHNTFPIAVNNSLADIDRLLRHNGFDPSHYTANNMFEYLFQGDSVGEVSVSYLTEEEAKTKVTPTDLSVVVFHELDGRAHDIIVNAVSSRDAVAFTYVTGLTLAPMVLSIPTAETKSSDDEESFTRFEVEQCQETARVHGEMIRGLTMRLSQRGDELRPEFLKASNTMLGSMMEGVSSATLLAGYVVTTPTGDKEVKITTLSQVLRGYSDDGVFCVHPKGDVLAVENPELALMSENGAPGLFVVVHQKPQDDERTITLESSVDMYSMTAFSLSPYLDKNGEVFRQLVSVLKDMFEDDIDIPVKFVPGELTLFEDVPTFHKEFMVEPSQFHGTAETVLDVFAGLQPEDDTILNEDYHLGGEE